MVHPGMEYMRPIAVNQAGQPQESEGARDPLRHTEIVHREARALERGAVCATGQKTDCQRTPHARCASAQQSGELALGAAPVEPG